MDLKAANIKLIAFVPPLGAVSDASAMWTQLINQPPQTFNQLQSPNGPSTVAQGMIHGSPFALTVQMGRIELTALATEDGNPSKLPIVHNEDAVAQVALSIIQKLPFPLVRLAINWESTQQCDSAEQGLDLLKDAVPPLADVPKSATDTHFGLNVRTRRNETEINRLVKWSVGVAQFMQIQNVFGSAGSIPHVLSELHFVQVSADVNTVPAANGWPIPQSEVASLWGALYEEAKSVIAGGYQYVVS